MLEAMQFHHLCGKDRDKIEKSAEAIETLIARLEMFVSDVGKQKGKAGRKGKSGTPTLHYADMLMAREECLWWMCESFPDITAAINRVMRMHGCEVFEDIRDSLKEICEEHVLYALFREEWIDYTLFYRDATDIVDTARMWAQDLIKLRDDFHRMDEERLLYVDAV